MINNLAFAVGVALIVVLTKISSFLAPFNLYFSISTLVVGGSEAFSPTALLVKLAIPFTVGFLLYAVPIRVARLGTIVHSSVGRSMSEYGRSSALPTSQAAAFFASLLMSWPMIVHWDVLAAFEIRPFKTVFFSAYLIYFVSYAIMCGAGTRTAIALMTDKSKPKWMSSARDSFIGGIMSGLASGLLVMFVRG